MLLRDAGFWRETETHIHDWPMLSYLSRFQILDGSPALEHLVSMRKSLIHLPPPVPDALPSLPPGLFVLSLRDSYYSAITPKVFHKLLISELSIWTFLAGLLINFIVTFVATLQQMRIFRRARRLFVHLG